MIICGMWSLWMLRNRRRHGEDGLPIRRAVLWVCDTTFDIWQLLHQPKEMVLKVKPTWKLSEEGWIKCNFDGAFYQDGSGATGAVRDHHGGFKGGVARWYDHCVDALTMEELAFRDGLILVKNHGVTRVSFETDCQELVNLWLMKADQRSSISAIIKEIQELSCSLISFSLSYTSRVCNLASHVLAKQVSSVCVMGEWHQAPSCVHQTLVSDCNHAIHQ